MNHSNPSPERFELQTKDIDNSQMLNILQNRTDPKLNEESQKFQTQDQLSENQISPQTLAETTYVEEDTCAYVWLTHDFFMANKWQQAAQQIYQYVGNQQKLVFVLDDALDFCQFYINSKGRVEDLSPFKEQTQINQLSWAKYWKSGVQQVLKVQEVMQKELKRRQTKDPCSFDKKDTLMDSFTQGIINALRKDLPASIDILGEKLNHNLPPPYRNISKAARHAARQKLAATNMQVIGEMAIQLSNVQTRQVKDMEEMVQKFQSLVDSWVANKDSTDLNSIDNDPALQNFRRAQTESSYIKEMSQLLIDYSFIAKDTVHQMQQLKEYFKDEDIKSIKNAFFTFRYYYKQLQMLMQKISNNFYGEQMSTIQGIYDVVSNQPANFIQQNIEYIFAEVEQFAQTIPPLCKDISDGASLFESLFDNLKNQFDSINYQNMIEYARQTWFKLSQDAKDNASRILSNMEDMNNKIDEAVQDDKGLGGLMKSIWGGVCSFFSGKAAVDQVKVLKDQKFILETQLKEAARLNDKLQMDSMALNITFQNLYQLQQTKDFMSLNVQLVKNISFYMKNGYDTLGDSINAISKKLDDKHKDLSILLLKRSLKNATDTLIQSKGIIDTVRINFEDISLNFVNIADPGEQLNPSPSVPPTDLPNLKVKLPFDLPETDIKMQSKQSHACKSKENKVDSINRTTFQELVESLRTLNLFVSGQVKTFYPASDLLESIGQTVYAYQQLIQTIQTRVKVELQQPIDDIDSEIKDQVFEQLKEYLSQVLASCRNALEISKGMWLDKFSESIDNFESSIDEKAKQIEEYENSVSQIKKQYIDLQQQLYAYIKSKEALIKKSIKDVKTSSDITSLFLFVSRKVEAIIPKVTQVINVPSLDGAHSLIQDAVSSFNDLQEQLSSDEKLQALQEAIKTTFGKDDEYVSLKENISRAFKDYVGAVVFVQSQIQRLDNFNQDATLVRVNLLKQTLEYEIQNWISFSSEDIEEAKSLDDLVKVYKKLSDSFVKLMQFHSVKEFSNVSPLPKKELQKIKFDKKEITNATQKTSKLNKIDFKKLQKQYEKGKARGRKDENQSDSDIAKTQKQHLGFSCLHAPRPNKERVRLGQGPLSLIAAKEYLWPQSVLKIYFMDPSNEARNEKVYNVAKLWEKYVNMTFEITNVEKQAHIIINYDESTSSTYSFVGQECLKYKDENGATMNFGWFDAFTSDQEYHATVLHEFGHALGFLHELQIPTEEIPWDRDYVIQLYKEEQGWEDNEIERQVLNRLDPNEYSTFGNRKIDVLSIMCYEIDARCLRREVRSYYPINCRNSQLSPVDKFIARKAYPVSLNDFQKRTQVRINTLKDATHLSGTVFKLMQKYSEFQERKGQLVGTVKRVHPCNGIQVRFEKDNTFWIDPELLIPLEKACQNYDFKRILPGEIICNKKQANVIGMAIPTPDSFFENDNQNDDICLLVNGKIETTSYKNADVVSFYNRAIDCLNFVDQSLEVFYENAQVTFLSSKQILNSFEYANRQDFQDIASLNGNKAKVIRTHMTNGVLVELNDTQKRYWVEPGSLSRSNYEAISNALDERMVKFRLLPNTFVSIKKGKKEQIGVVIIDLDDEDIPDEEVAVVILGENNKFQKVNVNFIQPIQNQNYNYKNPNLFSQKRNPYSTRPEQVTTRSEIVYPQPYIVVNNYLFDEYNNVQYYYENDETIRARFTYNDIVFNAYRIFIATAVIRLADLANGSNTTDHTRWYARNLGKNDDTAGHIIANSLGGSGKDPINIFPVSQGDNNRMYSNAERLIKEALQGNLLAVAVRLEFSYDDNSSTPFRPIKLKYYALGYDANNAQREVFENNPVEFEFQ